MILEYMILKVGYCVIFTKINDALGHPNSFAGPTPLKINAAQANNSEVQKGMVHTSKNVECEDSNKVAQGLTSAFRDDFSQENLTSPSVSQTLRADDTDSCSLVGETQEAQKEEIEGRKLKQSATTASWVTLFKDRKNIDERLKLHKVDGQPNKITLDANDVDDVEQSWGFCLVGYFIGSFPGKEAFVANVLYQYFIHESGWLIFKFKGEASRAKVLHGGLYLVFDRP